jgi:single-stranded-DNA-specific exonuclease
MLNLAVPTLPGTAFQALRQAGLPALLARLFAARGIAAPTEMKSRLAELLPVGELKNAEAAGARLADAIARQEKLLVVADYDADGATACAVAMAGLSALGARVDYLVPNRFEYGYGLSPEIVRIAAERTPDLLITVDNGIAAHAGIEEARRLGMDVLVTDHHLPARPCRTPSSSTPTSPAAPSPASTWPAWASCSTC